MHKRRPVSSHLPFTTSITALLFIASAIASGHAEAVQRAHVSALVGLDSNTSFNCDVAHPCRFFQAATTVVDPSGEVVVLDSGGYGSVTLTKSISLTAPAGVYAGISVFPGVDGVTIATAGVSVVLRGLTINGQGGYNGVNMTTGKKLTVENCVISNLAGSGISVSGTAIVRVTDTTIRDNATNGVFLQNGAQGIIIRAVIIGNVSAGVSLTGSTSSTTTANIADTTVQGSQDGISLYSGISTAALIVSVHDSRIVRNVNSGLNAFSASGATVSISASNNSVSNSGYGIVGTNVGTRIWASGNTVSDNAFYGFFNNGGLFESAGNNAVRNNGINTSGTVTAIPAI